MWPPRLNALSPRQLRMIELAEHAEAYVREQQRQHSQPDGSVARRHHDVAGSRREWARQFQ